MRYVSLFTITVLTFAAAVSVPSAAQQNKDQEPKTKLEAFTGVVGAVSIKGYVEVGSIKGSRAINVTAMTMRDAKSGKETSGAVLEIVEFKSYGTDTSRSYVDVDEITDLLSGLTYISKSDNTITPMPFYEAQYSTRGGVKLTVFNNANGERQFVVHVGGPIGGKDSYLTIHQLPEFWDLIAKAKEAVENPQKFEKINPKTGSAQTSAATAPPTSPARSTKRP